MELRDTPPHDASMEGLLLRPTTPADAAALLALYRDVAATPNSGLARHSEEMDHEYVAAFAGLCDPRGLSIAAFEGPTLAGEIHATRMRPRQFDHVLTDLTIAVHPRWQGRGVGSRLFAALFAAAARCAPPITRIELVARTGNAEAIRLYERLGFRAEGRFAGRVRLRDGRIEDDIPMARVAPGAGRDAASPGGSA
jgi:ribosomal protein S18 acetylase RimI-like enzyme